MRNSGVLMHISSLPSPYGIGSLGEQARRFADFLAQSRQSNWQVLPLSPTGFGDSPYQSFSSFAGNPYFLDLDTLAADGLLEREDYVNLDWGADPCRVDYAALFANRRPVLRAAAEKLLACRLSEFDAYCRENEFWLDDYSLFMALKDAHGGAQWSAWERPLRFRQADALAEARTALDGEISRYKALQFLFDRQWTALHDYARARGVSIVGDIPIYVAPDSADVWAHPELFELDAELRPAAVAGCPPDGFTADGQLWGNPLYAWESHRQTNYAWWTARIRRAFQLCDILRIDHFRGFEAYYSIPYGEETARNGAWRPGPGYALFDTLKTALGEKPIIAEDLGFLTDEVRNLLARCAYPGMKVLQFAFDGSAENPYLPHNYTHHCVAYAGTHDNDTLVGWLSSAPYDTVRQARDYLRLPDSGAARSVLQALWESPADLTIAQMQDILELGSEARMNTPGRAAGNWQWRMSPDTGLAEPADWLRRITELYGRAH